MRQGFRHGTWCICTSQSFPQEATGLTKPVRLFRHTEHTRPRDQVKAAPGSSSRHLDFATAAQIVHPLCELGLPLHLASVVAA